MIGIILSKSACQAGGDFLQRTDFLDAFMGNDLPGRGRPERGRPSFRKKQSQPPHHAGTRDDAQSTRSPSCDRRHR